MQTYLLRRALASIPTLFGVTVLIFIAMRVIPGDPIALTTAEFRQLLQEQNIKLITWRELARAFQQ